MLVDLAMFGWIGVVLALFALMRPRRAVLTSFILGWLFLPMASYQIQGLPDYSKESATSMLVFLAALLFDTSRVLRFRPRLIDVPIVLWCLCPIATSLSNELGFYDGLSASLKTGVWWGLPYLIGRIYFTDLASLRELAMAIFIGGVIYLPFCLWEIRMSPRLHLLVYGFRQHSFGQQVKFGGYRPLVFMQHGLMVAMWMASATLVGTWLWLGGSLKRIRGIDVRWVLGVMAVTTVLCKSLASIGFLFIGVAALLFCRWGRTSLFLGLLAASPLVYMFARSAGGWDGLVLAELGKLVSQAQYASIETRVVSENHFIAKARDRLVLGWGGHSRINVTDEKGRDIAVPDGMWVIALAERGLVGLSFLTAAVLMPSIVMLRRFPVWSWSRPETAPAVVLGVMMILYMLDCVPNAMVNPIFMLAGGGVCAQRGYRAGTRAVARRQRPVAAGARTAHASAMPDLKAAAAGWQPAAAPAAGPVRL